MTGDEKVTGMWKAKYSEFLLRVLAWVIFCFKTFDAAVGPMIAEKTVTTWATVVQ